MVRVVLIISKVVNTPTGIPYLTVVDIQVFIALQTHESGLILLTLPTSLPKPPFHPTSGRVCVYWCVHVIRVSCRASRCGLFRGIKFVHHSEQKVEEGKVCTGLLVELKVCDVYWITSTHKIIINGIYTYEKRTPDRCNAHRDLHWLVQAHSDTNRNTCIHTKTREGIVRGE